MTNQVVPRLFVYIVFQEVLNCLQVSVCDSCVQWSVSPRGEREYKYKMAARASGKR